MDKKAIQEKRKKGYFIEAAKNIIREKGMKNLTVKKVADIAGFSAGTLYNYFSDLNDLYSYCAEDFWEECKKYVLASADDRNIKQKIITYAKAYCQYFIDNPNIFELIFLSDIGEMPDKTPEVVLLLVEVLHEGVEKGLIPDERRNMVEKLLSSSIHGLLLFIIKKRTKATKEEVLVLIVEEAKYILESCQTR